VLIWSVENFLSPTEVQKHHQNRIFHQNFPLQKQLSATIKIQKSISSHVCANKKGLVRHAITPRTLLDAHGPKEVSESKQYGLTTHRKCFRDSQSQPLDSLTCNFYTILMFFSGKWLLKGYQIAKITVFPRLRQ